MPVSRPFDDRQAWWWRILAPLAFGFFGAIWSAGGLWSLAEQQHEDLYALLAHTDSAGTGQVFWKAGGEHHAFLFLTLPFYFGVGSMVLALVVGSIGMRRALGWPTFLGYWLFGLLCTAGFAAFMGLLWINATGLFI